MSLDTVIEHVTVATTAERSRALPRVDLLPPVFAEQARARRTKSVLGGLVAVAVLTTGGLYVQQRSVTASASSALVLARHDERRLTAGQSAYASVPKVYAAVDKARGERVLALGDEVRWSEVLTELGANVPSNVWLTSVQVTQSSAVGAATSTAPAPASTPSPGSSSATTGSATTAGATAGSTTAGSTTAGSTTAGAGAPLSPSVVAPGDIAAITISGKALTQSAIATWLTNLARQGDFDAPSFSSSIQDSPGLSPTVTFTSTVQVTSNALTHRYDSTGQ